MAWTALLAAAALAALLVATPAAHAEVDVCNNPCSPTACTCNGRNYDISVIQGPNTPWIYSSSDPNYFYYLQVVNGGLPSAGLPRCSWSDASHSQGNVAGQGSTFSSNTCTSLGLDSQPTWLINTQTSTPILSIRFTGGMPAQGYPRTTVLQITCDPTQTGPVSNFTVTENPPLTYNFYVSHAVACAPAPPPSPPGPGDYCNNPCTATFCYCNGRTYNLNNFRPPSIPYFYYHDLSNNYYFFELIGSGLPPSGLVLCQWDNPMYSINNVAGINRSGNTSCMAAGNVNKVLWAIDTTQKPSRLILTFTGGESIQGQPIQTVATIICCPTCASPVLSTAYVAPDSPTVNYIFYSSAAC